MSLRNVCRSCEDRYPACWGSCERYKKEKEQNDILKERARKRREEDQYFIDKAKKETDRKLHKQRNPKPYHNSDK